MASVAKATFILRHSFCASHFALLIFASLFCVTPGTAEAVPS